ncbi:4-oxalomesaconate hydratase [Acrocarpospora pleiomorpha]|uniref:4-oxalomesaconate hydratase n=1 Tax=Acrocarpospora pleiomorpha TaxID=90975 RepID=A0A5M3Y355_9ACTN|nr:amidohydrolase family protein [Acrocarpospora pleiomorpha]GES26343.1 4-oxalomesaconate hydratase [Acrocarpospora pleiomorpha]
MIIDSHAHYTTAPPQLDAYRGRQVGRLNMQSRGGLKISDDEIRDSLRGHIERMDRLGVAKMIFSPRASGMGHEVGNEQTSLYWTQVNNDLIARVCDLFPDRFIPACQLPQSPGVSPANCLDELTRCVEEMGFVGCNINPDVAGGGQPFTPPMGDRSWYPLFERMVELDVPGLIHASSTVNPALHLNGSHYTNVDAAAVFELCWSDLLDNIPELKLIVPHGGGSIPFQFNRLRSLNLGGKRKPFEEAVKRVYFDTAVYDRDSMEMLIRKIGADNILFATEPFGTAKNIDPQTGRTFDDTISFVDDIDWLTAEDKEKIFVGNARRLYSRAKL